MVDFIISTKTEKFWSSSIHKQGTNNEEAAIENEYLKKRTELIDQGQNKKDFSVKDGKLYKRDGNQWIVRSPKSETKDNI